MTAHTPITKLEPSWPLRWEAAKGTANETWVLMTIAAEAHKAGEFDVWRAAYDAANCPDERDGFVENLEELFDEAEEAEREHEANRTEEWASEAMRNAGVYRGASIEARLDDAARPSPPRERSGATSSAAARPSSMKRWERMTTLTSTAGSATRLRLSPAPLPSGTRWMRTAAYRMDGSGHRTPHMRAHWERDDG